MKIRTKIVFGILFSFMSVFAFSQENTDVVESAATEVSDSGNQIENETVNQSENESEKQIEIAAENQNAENAEETKTTEEIVENQQNEALDLSQIEKLEPSKKIESSDGNSAVVIKTSIINADVYLNGNYQGKSDLEIKNLLPGNYVLKIEKPGYRNEIFQIEVESGISSEYTINLAASTGTLVIRHLVPGTNVQILGSQYRKDFVVEQGVPDYEFKVGEGRYYITLRKFGFQQFQDAVYVEQSQKVEMNIHMKEIEMMVSDVTVNKKIFNPEYKNVHGEVNVTFFVNASAPMSASIRNSSSGEEVWHKNWTEFNTWMQSFDWDGTNQFTGKKVEDGKYTIFISSDHFDYSMEVIVDRKVHYPLFTPNATGAGIGNLPSLFGESQRYFSPFVTVTPTIHVSNNQADFYDAKTYAGFISKSDHSEFSLSGNMNPGYDGKNVLGLNSALKIFNSAGDLDFGILIRYSFSSKAFANTIGIDTGNGLGAGALANLDLKYFNMGLSSQFIMGSQRGLFNFKENLWENGVTLSGKFGYMVRADLWCALCSYFGENPSWVKAIESGADLVVMLGNSNALLNFDFTYTNILGSDQYFAQSIGLFYLF